MYFESLYCYILGLRVNQEKYKCVNHKLLKNMIINKNGIHLFSEISSFKKPLQRKYLLLRKHHEKHSVCSTVLLYALLSLLIYSNFIVTYNDCLQLYCEFSTLTEYESFFLMLCFDIQILIIWESYSFCLGNHLVFKVTIFTFYMHIYFSSGDIICNIIYECMNLFLFNVFYCIKICASVLMII